MTFENVADLHSHNDMVRSIVWSADDSKLVSCGEDGAVYEWDTFTGKRIGETVLKGCYYTNVAVTPDGKTSFAVGSDKTIKEIADSQVSFTVHLQNHIKKFYSRPKSYAMAYSYITGTNLAIVIQILREVDTNDVVLTSVAMSHSGRMLFTGTNTGALRAYKFPLTVPGEWTDFQGHSASILKVFISMILFPRPLIKRAILLQFRMAI